MKSHEPNITDSDEWKKIESEILSFIPDRKPNHQKILEDIFKGVVKLALGDPGTLNLKITSTVLRELRYSFRMFSPYRHSPKITMFGSARVPTNTPLYQFAKKFAEEAVDRKYMIITGGGPGIMAAGNEGASFDSGFGLNIRLPFEQSANPFIDPKKKLLTYKYFFIRKLFLVKEASAFAFLPGGMGTMDEAFEALTLLQTGKSNLVPVVLLEPKGFGFWTKLKKYFDEVVLKKGFISKSDSYLYRICHSPKEALDHFDLFYHRFHSLRYIKNGVVIRLKHPVSDVLVKKANSKFKSLTQAGKIVKTGPLEEEFNEPEIEDLPRLTFPFEKKDFGELRHLIDFINEN